MRTGRNQLANESDMLKQKLVQDSISLKDDLKGMFDDRKMTVRIEQKAVESKVCLLLF